MALRAITRTPCVSLAKCELIYLARETIDFALALEQHRGYCENLRRAGVKVETLASDDSLPDSVFVEDAAVVLDEVAVITRPGAESRRGETEAMSAALAEYRQLVRIEGPGTLDGGDVLRIGKELFVGLSPRTNREGIEGLAAIVGKYGYRVTPVAVRDCLHLKSAVTGLDEGTVLVNPQWLDVGPFAGFRVVHVPKEEPFAANTLCLGGTVYVSKRSPRTRELLEGLGYRTKVLSLSELEKAEAGMTCMSVIFA